jgi:hypothetical protein
MTELPDEFAEIAKNAFRGETQSLKALFSAGDRALAQDQDNDNEAAVIFGESAICYRIAALNERAKKEEQQNRSDFLVRELEAVSKSLEKHRQGLSYTDIQGKRFPGENIRDIFLRDIWEDSSWITYFQILESRWVSRGVQFFSPGGSLQRQIISTLLRISREAENCSKQSKSVSPLDILIPIEPIFEEVKRRLLQPQ